MGKGLRIFLIAALVFALPCAEAFETRDELRSAYRAIESLNADSLFDSEPSIRAPYAPGKILTDEARRNALDTGGKCLRGCESESGGRKRTV